MSSDNKGTQSHTSQKPKDENLDHSHRESPGEKFLRKSFGQDHTPVQTKLRSVRERPDEYWTVVEENVRAVAAEAYGAAKIQQSKTNLHEHGQGKEKDTSKTTVKNKSQYFREGVLPEFIQEMEVGDLKQKEAKALLAALRNSPYFAKLSEQDKEAIIREQEKGEQLHALDILTMRERDPDHGIESELTEELISDQKSREKREDQYRLQHLWRQRKAWHNWLILITFDLFVIVNLIHCIHESFRITLEHAKFDRLYLQDDFNCLERVESDVAVNHIFNILLSFTCVVVLFSDSLETANLCWAYVIAQVAHVCMDTFQFFYNIRFPHESKDNDSAAAFLHFFFFDILFGLCSTILVIKRYYDMTNVVTKRAKRLTNSIYSGRLMNEHIIFKNASKFMQKKYTLRQAQALQIFWIVQKIHYFKQKGVEMSSKEVNLDVQNAMDVLTEMKQKKHSTLLKELTELKKKNAANIEKLKNAYMVDEVGVGATKDGKKTAEERLSRASSQGTPGASPSSNSNRRTLADIERANEIFRRGSRSSLSTGSKGRRKSDAGGPSHTSAPGKHVAGANKDKDGKSKK